ncbi:MAG: DUF1549 domain-containing protein [Pirellulaceae bacterium]
MVPALKAMLFATLFLGSLVASLFAQEVVPGVLSLHQRIDQIAPLDPASPWTPEPLPPGQWLRRLSLDLRNTVPTRKELDEFLADTASDRQSRWIDRFLADPLFEERLVTWLDITLMERRGAQQVGRPEWIDWLRSGVEQDWGLDRWARELLEGSWAVDAQRPTQRFYLDRGGDPHRITRDFGRIFLGRDLQCAQCHDHPLVDGYRQQDYHGLLAFFAPSSMVEIATKDAEVKEVKKQYYIEKAPGDAPFESVFDKGKPHWVGRKLWDAVPQWSSYQLPSDRYGDLAIAGTVAESPRLPKLSSRKELAAALLAPGYQPFAENWANRLWALVFDRGLVHPLDMHHPGNPPSDPALLATITQGLIDHRFQVKPFLRELVMTQRYRLGQQTLSQQPGALESIAAAAGTSAAALAEGDRQAIQEAIDSANEGWIAARDALAAIEKECVRLVKERDGGEAAYQETVKKTAEAVKVLQPLAETADKTAKKLAALQAAYQQLEVVQALTSPEDPALMQTLQQLGARRDTAATEATAAEAARLPAQQAVDAARTAEDAAQKHLVALASQLDSQRSAYEEAQQSLLAARRRWDQSTLALRRMERQAGVLAKRQAWETPWQSYQQIARTVAPIQRPLEELKRLSANDAAMRQGVAGKLAETTSQRDPLQQKLQAAQSQAMQFQRAADAWKASLKQLQSVQQLLEQVSDYQPLVASINQQLQVANTQLGTAQLQAQTLAEELKGIDATILQYQQQIGQFDQSLAARQPQIDALSTTLEKHRAAWDAARGSLLLANRKWMEEVPEAWAGSPMRPLSPEQYCASCLQISGHLEQHVLQERKAIDEAEKVPEGTEMSPEEKRRRDRLATRRAIDKLRGNFDQFATLYSAGAGQPEAFFATAEQALFLANGGAVYGWSGSNGSNATARVILAADADAAAEELYQSLLARSPTVEEKGLVAEYWNGPAEQRPARAQELVWAILCGVEFRFVQ